MAWKKPNVSRNKAHSSKGLAGSGEREGRLILRPVAPAVVMPAPASPLQLLSVKDGKQVWWRI